MEFLRNLLGSLSSDSYENAAILNRKRAWEEILADFQKEIGLETFENLNQQLVRNREPGDYFLLNKGRENVLKSEEKVSDYLEPGLLDKEDIAGRRFYTLTERGRYFLEYFGDISDEIDRIENISSYSDDVIEEISDLEEKTPEDYDLGIERHSSGLWETQKISSNGSAVRRITEEGEQVKRDIEENMPLRTARVVNMDEVHLTNPLEKMTAIQRYSEHLDESKASEEVIGSISEAIKQENLEIQIQCMDTYLNIVNMGAMPQIEKNKSYVLDLENQITGVKSIYSAAQGQEDTIEISESVGKDEIISMLNSDMQDIYNHVEEVHRQTYSEG